VLEQIYEEGRTDPPSGCHPLRVQPIEVPHQIEVSVDGYVGLRGEAVALEREPAQVPVQQVRGDVLHRPERAGGGPTPVARVQAAKQRDQLGVEGREPVGEMDRSGRSRR
jgi:hypothetical protein